MRKAKRSLVSLFAGLALLVLALSTAIGSSNAAQIAQANVQPPASTSTQDADTNPIAMLGAALIGLGGFLLMRTPRSTT